MRYILLRLIREFQPSYESYQKASLDLESSRTRVLYRLFPTIIRDGADIRDGAEMGRWDYAWRTLNKHRCYHRIFLGGNTYTLR